ncbi:MAG TPA: response regulator [Thermoanaerobaculia bacterium]|nr:response regulator [Thermoanaerobaculia bacterium]
MLEGKVQVQAMGEGDKARVLVVDDDPHIRKMMIASLRRDGYELSEAANGARALELMRGGEVDLVLLDLMMPEISGWDVLRERAEEPALRNIPVIVISANREPKLADAVQNGVAAFLPKPFDLPMLHAIVRGALGQE